jgi:hypothetical protein
MNNVTLIISAELIQAEYPNFDSQYITELQTYIQKHQNHFERLLINLAIKNFALLNE